MVILPIVKEVKKIEGALLYEEPIDPESSPFLQDFEGAWLVDVYNSLWPDLLSFLSPFGLVVELRRLKDLFFYI